MLGLRFQRCAAFIQPSALKNFEYSATSTRKNIGNEMSGSTSNASATGRFTTSNAQILDPSGNVFKARGIAVGASEMQSANQILASFPGLNFIRLTIFDYQSPDTYASFINTMTSRGIVVELEDHTSSDGSNHGGSSGQAFTGSQLTNELNWYSSVANAYASNPYVWFGTDNEPPAAGLTDWQKATYDAIRNTGNANPIMLEMPGGGWIGPQDIKSYGMDPSVYATMSNTVVDVHYYGWYSDYNTDQKTVNNVFSDLVKGAQTVPSTSGPVPVMVGEYGISTDGSTADPNAAQVFSAAQNISTTSGAVAFTWTAGGLDSLADSQGKLTSYGQQVAQWIASQAGSSTVSSAQSLTSNTITPSPVSSSATPGMSFISSPTATSTGSSANPNTVVLQAAGSGVTSVQGGDLMSGTTLLDLRPALAATSWDGSASTLRSYLGVTASPDTSIIMITGAPGQMGSPVAVVTGSPRLTFDGLLAHAIT